MPGSRDEHGWYGHGLAQCSIHDIHNSKNPFVVHPYNILMFYILYRNIYIYAHRYMDKTWPKRRNTLINQLINQFKSKSSYREGIFTRYNDFTFYV